MKLIKKIIVGLLFTSLVSLYARESLGNIKNKKDFFKKIKENEFVIAKFEASWCAACKEMSKNVDPHITKRYKDSILFIKVDIDQYKDLAKKYKVMGVPTYIFFHQGEEIDRFIGVNNSNFFDRKIKNFISSSQKTE